MLLQDGQRDIAAGRFQHDLYYRINVVNVDLPPLPARRDGIADLTDYLALESQARRKRAQNQLSRPALQDPAGWFARKALPRVVNAAKAITATGTVAITAK